MPRKGSKKYKHSAEYTTWCFTLNNYKWQEIARLQESVEPSDNRLIASIAWSEEIGGKKNVPHLQGFIQVYKKSMLITRSKLKFFAYI